VQEGGFVRYAGIDEAREHLKLRHLFVPVYYPSSIGWPPSLVAGQKRPYPAAVIELPKREGEGPGLAITQTAGSHPPLRDAVPLAVVRERTAYTLKGRAALIESGLCPGEERCSRISWDEEGFRIVAAMADSPVELLRVAESMLPGPGPSVPALPATGTKNEFRRE
jgi:hypothetical protein